MTRARFLEDLNAAAEEFLGIMGRKAKCLEQILHGGYDSDLHAVSEKFEIGGAGDCSSCNVSKAIVIAACYKDDPLRIFAAAEAAWESNPNSKRVWDGLGGGKSY